MSKRIAMIAMLMVGITGCSASAPPPDTRAIQAATHDAYLAAINSNDVDKLMASLTDDVVFQSAHRPEMVGKHVIRPWLSDYFAGHKMKWDAPSIGFTVSGDWAFERYTFKATETDRKTNAVTTTDGKGLTIFRRSPDGKWLVAIDSWSPDAPVAQ